MNLILIWSVILFFSIQAILAVTVIRIMSDDSLIKKMALIAGVVDVFIMLTSMIEVVYTAFGLSVSPMRLALTLVITSTTMIVFWFLRSWQEKRHDRI